MADLLEMSCACGYRTSVHTGGLMSNFNEVSWWPFYCHTCGVVNVNWRQEIQCPGCGSGEVIPYGEAPASRNQSCELAYVQAWDYRACQVGHLCPRCSGYSLKFDRGMLWMLAD